MMYLKDNRKRTTILIGEFVLIFLSLLSIILNDFYIASNILLLQTILCCIIISYSGYGFVSVPVFFIILSYIFHYSQFFLYSLEIDYDVAFDIVARFGEKFCISLMNFFSIGLCFLSFGMLVNIKLSAKKIGSNIVLDDEGCQKLGYFLMAVCGVPRISSDISNFKEYLTFGYESTFTGETGLILVFAYGFYIGMLFVLLGNRQDASKSFRLLIVFSCYLLVTMICGRRMEQTGVLVVMIIIYMNYCTRKKVKTSRIILFSIIGYILMAFISTMGDMRHSLNISFDLYWKQFVNNIKGDMIVGQLAEFGDTGISLGYSMKSFPLYKPFHIGLTYIFAWMQVLPNIGGIIKKLFGTSIAFTEAIPSVFQGNYGCSYLGELYYNFGWFGTVAMCLVGFFIGRISRNVNYMVKNKISINGLMNLAIMPTIITYVRGSFSDFVRIYVYYYVLIYFVGIQIRKGMVINK